MESRALDLGHIGKMRSRGGLCSVFRSRAREKFSVQETAGGPLDFAEGYLVGDTCGAARRSGDAAVGSGRNSFVASGCLCIRVIPDAP